MTSCSTSTYVSSTADEATAGGADRVPPPGPPPALATTELRPPALETVYRVTTTTAPRHARAAARRSDGSAHGSTAESSARTMSSTSPEPPLPLSLPARSFTSDLCSRRATMKALLPGPTLPRDTIIRSGANGVAAGEASWCTRAVRRRAHAGPASGGDDVRAASMTRSSTTQLLASSGRHAARMRATRAAEGPGTACVRAVPVGACMAASVQSIGECEWGHRRRCSLVVMHPPRHTAEACAARPLRRTASPHHAARAACDAIAAAAECACVVVQAAAVPRVPGCAQHTHTRVVQRSSLDRG